MSVLAMQLNSSSIVGTSGLKLSVEGADMHLCAIHVYSCSPRLGSLISRYTLKYGPFAVLRALVSEIRTMSANANICPAIVKAVAVYMVNMGSIWWGRDEPVKSNGPIVYPRHGVVEPIPCLIEAPRVPRHESNIGRINRGKSPLGQRDSGGSVSIVYNLPASGKSIAGRTAKLLVNPTGINKKGATTMIASFANGIFGAHMNHLSCAMPREVAASPGLSVPSIIPEFRTVMGVSA